MYYPLEKDTSYVQPIDLLKLEGDRFELPGDFVDGLSTLRPFVKRRGNPVEQWVHLIDGNFIVITNSIIIEFKLLPGTLPDLKFSSGLVRLLEAFESLPTSLILDGKKFGFEWSDGQQLTSVFTVNQGPIWFADSGPIGSARGTAVDNYWQFDKSKPICANQRKDVLHSLSVLKTSEDVFLLDDWLVTRGSSKANSASHSFEHVDQFSTNSERPMRFDRTAFRLMMKVAECVDFSVSPVCFRHANGRGLIVERTLGSDVPELDWVE